MQRGLGRVWINSKTIRDLDVIGGVMEEGGSWGRGQKVITAVYMLGGCREEGKGKAIYLGKMGITWELIDNRV